MKKMSVVLTVLMLSAGVFTACSGDSDSLARAEKETQAQWGLTFYESEGETETETSAESETEKEADFIITEVADGVKMLAVDEVEIQAVSPVNVRSGPSADFDKKGTLQKEQTVILKGVCDNEWVQILLNEETGYVSAKYVQSLDENKTIEDMLKEAEEILASNPVSGKDSEEESSSEESEESESQKETEKETEKETKKETKEETQAKESEDGDDTAENLAWSTIDVNVRKGPGASYDSVGILKQNKSVKVLDSSDAWWWKVEFEGQEAYISVQYLTTDKPE